MPMLKQLPEPEIWDKLIGHGCVLPLAMTVNSIKPKQTGLRLENWVFSQENQGLIIISILGGC